MQISEENKEYIRFKLKQAREATMEAEGLLAEGAELGYVINSLYYGFYYPVLAMLQVKGIPGAMQSVSIALFEKEFRETDLFEIRFFDSIRKAFELKPKCSGGSLNFIAKEGAQKLLHDVIDFQLNVSRITGVF